MALLLALGCQADSAPSAGESETKPEVPAETKPVVDRKIESAVAAARNEAPAAGSSGQATPPEDGILGVEAAARELAPGSAAQLILGTAGAEPRLRLGPARILPGAGPSGALQLSYRSGGSVMPTVEFELKLKTSPGEEAPSGAAPAPGSGPELLVTRFGLGGARPADEQPGRLPENARTEIAKLNGSWVDFVTTARGAAQSQRWEVAGKNPELQPFVQASAQALAAVALPYPEVPVGAGAFWMVKSRESVDGSDVIAYRMVKLSALTQELATLSVATRRYLITPALGLEGLPPHRVRQFQSEGNATLRVRPGAAYPSSADIEDQVAALLAPDGRPGQAVPVQSELRARLQLSP